MANDIIILGAGITGLSIALKLSEAGYKVKIIEKNDYIGGMSTTFNYKDYFLDYGPHKIFTLMPDIMEEINKLFKNDPLLTVKKSSKIRLKGKYLNFPFGMKDIFLRIGFVTGFKCGMGYLGSILKNIFVKPKDISYEDWVINRFGKATYNLVLKPYANKIWGCPKELSKELAETRIAAPSLLEMIKQIIFGKKKESPVINADIFYYPKRGCIEISEKMVEIVKNNGGELVLNKNITKIENDNGYISKIIYQDGSTETTDNNCLVINTIPLPIFLDKINHIENEAIEALKKLKFRSLILLYVELDIDRLIFANWLFFPESKYRFNRVFEQKAFSETMVPGDKTVICIEITCGEEDELLNMSDKEIFIKLKPQLEEADLFKAEVLDYFTKRLKYGYPVYDIYYKQNLDVVLSSLEKNVNLFSVGRQGGYSYSGMADSMDIGFSTAEFIIANRDKNQEWKSFREKFYKYIVVD